MNERRPNQVLIALAVIAAVGFVGSGLLDVHGNWGEPRQAAANVLWIAFLLSVVGLVVTGARLIVRRR